MPILTALLTIFAVGVRSVPLNNNEPFEISIFEKPPGLFFEHKTDAYVAISNWNLIGSIDLNKFRMMFEHFNQKMGELATTCEGRFEKNDACHEWMDILDSKIQNLHNKFDMITPNGSRDKRAVLDFIGNMAGDIFGIMDARSRKQHMKDIRNLMANDEHLMNLLKNQTSVVEKTLNILRVNGDEIKRQNEQFLNFTKRIDKTMDEYAADG